MIAVKRSIKEMKEYVAGRSIEEVARSYGIDERDIVKLASNENCLGPSPKAIEAIRATADDVHLYPSVDAIELRAELAKFHRMPVDTVVTGAGMDGVIETLLRAYLDKDDKSLIPLPTFSYYEIVTRYCSAFPVYSMRKQDFSLDVDDIVKKAGKRTKFIFITTPNNPTGNVTPIDDVRAIVESVKSMVFLDEAYIDFGGESALPLIGKYDNLIIGRTMSKAWGLAGLRIGYAFMPETAFKEYMKVATPFSVSKISIAAAVAALNDTEHYRASIDAVTQGRDYLRKNIPFKTFHSDANFILMDTSPLKSGYVVDKCMRKGIILRDCASFRELGDTYVRITVGTQTQNERLVATLKEIYEQT